MVDPVQRAHAIEFIHYFYACFDQMEWDKVRTCFADDVHYDMSSVTSIPGGVMPKEQFIETWVEGLKNNEFMHHQISNHRVSSDPETGEIKVLCYGTTYHKLEASQESHFSLVIGEYEIRLKEKGDSWQITTFIFFSKHVRTLS